MCLHHDFQGQFASTPRPFFSKKCFAVSLQTFLSLRGIKTGQNLNLPVASKTGIRSQAVSFWTDGCGY